MIWTEAEPRGSRWSNCLVPKDKLSSPTTASSLTFLYSKKIFAEHKEEKKQFFTDVAFMFAWISVLARLWWGGESWMPQILLWRWGHRSIRHFFSVPSQKVGADGQCCLSHALPILTWLWGLPFICVPGQYVDLLLSLPFWAVCFLLVPRGSPKGFFRVSWQEGRHRGCSWPYKEWRWRALKIKNPTHKHTQTFYNSVFIGA